MKGSLSKLQDRKEELYGVFVHKENEVEMIFSELNANLTELEQMKMNEEKLVQL